jgi:hypothetical protein
MNLITITAVAVLLPLSAAMDISSNSPLGQRLLQLARPVDVDPSQHGRWLNENDNNAAADYSYIAEYSIKFQGCHHVQQWNDNVDEDSDVRIMTKRLARFRLCPTDQCSNDKSSGCSSKYGDYVVDVRIYKYSASAKSWKGIRVSLEVFCRRLAHLFLSLMLGCRYRWTRSWRPT